MLNVLVFWSWVLLLPRLPPWSRSLRLSPWASILLYTDLWSLLGSAARSSPTTRAKTGRTANVFTAQGGMRRLLRWEKGPETPSCDGEKGLRLPHSSCSDLGNEGVSDPFPHHPFSHRKGENPVHPNISLAKIPFAQRMRMIGHRCPTYQLRLPPKTRVGDPESPLQGNAGKFCGIWISFLAKNGKGQAQGRSRNSGKFILGIPNRHFGMIFVSG